ncbi:thiopurine S-methyltransferase family protein [Caballeronia sordidicola]|uniref:Thiopurine S-methyltransferase family protein n=1 Tax=Caballeronia sordidicola TaxID=196367 RepID=A0A158F3W7_CABSO|nr:methyltransferase domain-containing protein [Caballeronia sordidicola]SAL14558.1 thiopurine S-methyltransferase family protein [Caballeronia sordidicola]
MVDDPKPASPTIAAEFATRDANSPEFWDERFDRSFMPWDQAGVPEAFQTFALEQPVTLRSVLIPGCGSAYEALWLAQEKWQVKAIDFSPSAVSAARLQLGEQHADVVEQADFFAYQPPFAPDWIYERAFLCALPRERWPDYATRMAALLRPGALLAGFYFLGATAKGPPFGIERNALDALLVPHFELVEEHDVTGSISVFAGRERWLTWRRRSEV